MRKLELSLLIPTYNEGDIIESSLREIATSLGGELSKKTEIIVVDDGTDKLTDVINRTKSTLGFASVEVLRNAPPLGKGRSLAKGFALANAPVVGFLDADLSTPPSYIMMALEIIQKDRTDVFIGSRHSDSSEMTREQSPVKEVMGDVLRLAINAFIFRGGKRYRDTQCGFKFFKNEVAKVLYEDLVAGDGLTDVEVLIRANLLKLRVQEVGVKWTDVRESKRSLRRILWGELKAITAIILHYKLFANEKRRKLKLASERLS